MDLWVQISDRVSECVSSLRVGPILGRFASLGLLYCLLCIRRWRADRLKGALSRFQLVEALSAGNERSVVVALAGIPRVPFKWLTLDD